MILLPLRMCTSKESIMTKKHTPNTGLNNDRQYLGLPCATTNATIYKVWHLHNGCVNTVTIWSGTWSNEQGNSYQGQHEGGYRIGC